VTSASNDNSQRWYDHDPKLVEAIEVLRQFENELKSQAEIFLARLQDAVGEEAIEQFYKDILAARGDKMGRRWYDKDETLSKAIELLKVAPPEAQRQIAESFLASLHEQGIVPVNSAS
jgi:hypothetical protein